MSRRSMQPRTATGRLAFRSDRKSRPRPPGCLLRSPGAVIAVADGHFRDVRDVTDLALGHLLVGEQRRGVHRCGGSPTGTSRNGPLGFCVLEELSSPALHFLGEVQVAGEAGNVALRVRGLIQAEFADDVPVRAGDPSFSTRETAVNSSSDRGVPACRAAAYSDAVATPPRWSAPEAGRRRVRGGR